MSMRSLDYDIVIIGSGAGGGTVAKELAPLCKDGARIALLEWGGKFSAKDNTREEVPMASRYYFDGGGFQTKSQDMTLAFAKAVGGSTTVYTGTSLKAPQHVFDKWAVPGISLRELAPRYDKYIRENNVHLLPDGELNKNNKLFRDACKKLGWRVEQFPVNVKGCNGLATCNLGCSRLAKQGTNTVQIPAAEAGGVEVISFCKVNRIAENEVFAEVLPPQYNLAPSSLPTGEYRIKAKKIILCAGSMGSPGLLQKSYGEFNPALGRWFTAHPAIILMAEHDDVIDGPSGHPKSFYCDEFMDSEKFLLETCMYFPFIAAKSLTGFGQEPESFLQHFDKLQMILALAMDKAEQHNRVYLDSNGNTVVDYKISEATVKSLSASIRASARIFLASGARRVHVPGADRFFINKSEEHLIDQVVTPERFKLGQVSISAAHLMGGCRMGEDTGTSVTDSWGRVHGKKDLYVADASLFPHASEVNPYLTIMALADRVAEGVRKDLGT